MGFGWSFGLAMLFPLLTLAMAFGCFYCAKQAVANIMTGGFRTELATSSQVHYEFANRLAGKLFLGLGILLTLGTLFVFLYPRWSGARPAITPNHTALPNWDHLFYAVMIFSIITWLITMAIVQLRLQKIPPPPNPELDH